MGTLFSKIHTFPALPGCYIMKDHLGAILYIGKAKSLRKRVLSYFHHRALDEKTSQLVEKISDVDFIVTDKESDALILEAQLIRKHRPRYNIDLKDSQRYAYLLLTAEEYPRLITVRDRSLPGKYFGPYTDAMHREKIAEYSRRLFGLRTCGTKLPKRVCLQYHLHRCPAPCERMISLEDYRHGVSQASLFLEGKMTRLKGVLEMRMKEYSRNMEYEKAMKLRDAMRLVQEYGQKGVSGARKYHQDVISFLQYGDKMFLLLFHFQMGIITEKNEFILESGAKVIEDFITLYYSSHPVPKEIILPRQLESQELYREYLQNLYKKQGGDGKVLISSPHGGIKKSLLQMVEKNIQEIMRQENPALVELRAILNLQSVPAVIESFDVSNLRDIGIVGAMIQYRGDDFDKNSYRRFKIRTLVKQDDFGAMFEIVGRRYRGVVERSQPLPDLVLIDGGRGQLTAASRALMDAGLQIPVIALAKRDEEIYTLHGEAPLRIARKNPALRLLQKIRDETHRFAIRYHRLLRSKIFSRS